VAAERDRIMAMTDTRNTPIVVKDMRKVFPSLDGAPPKVAVRTLTLGIEKVRVGGGEGGKGEGERECNHLQPGRALGSLGGLVAGAGCGGEGGGRGGGGVRVRRCSESTGPLQPLPSTPARPSPPSPQGECFGLLGPNGAGKSTSINMMTGFLEPSTGTAVICGKDIRTDMNAIYTIMGVCPQHDLLWDSLTGGPPPPPAGAAAASCGCGCGLWPWLVASAVAALWSGVGRASRGAGALGAGSPEGQLA
jgi:hypothetical protein